MPGPESDARVLAGMTRVRLQGLSLITGPGSGSRVLASMPGQGSGGRFLAGTLVPGSDSRALAGVP